MNSTSLRLGDWGHRDACNQVLAVYPILPWSLAHLSIGPSRHLHLLLLPGQPWVGKSRLGERVSTVVSSLRSEFPPPVTL